MTHGPAARLAGCAPECGGTPGVVYWTRLEGAAREPKARLLHSMEAVATASVSLQRYHDGRSAGVSAFASAPARSSPTSSRRLARRRVSLPASGRVVGPPGTCRWPRSEGRSGVGRGPAAATQRQVSGTSIVAAYAPISAHSHTRARTCRCPRCLRRDWQSEASTSRSRRRGFPGRSTAGWRSDGTSAGRAGPPAIRTRDEPGRSMGAVAIRRDLAVVREEPERERIRVAGRRGEPGVGRRGALVPSGSRSF